MADGNPKTPNPYVFGYGSLIWNPGFPFVSSQKALPRRQLGCEPSIQLYHHQPIPRDAKGNKHRTNQQLKSIKFGGRR